MANDNSPRGFTPVCYRSGAPYNGAVRRYYKDATANSVIAVGDIVIRGTGSGSADGYPECVRATASSAITGVVQGVEPINGDPSAKNYLAAGDIGYVYVADDPNLLFEVQEGGAGSALAITDIGQHLNTITAVDGDIVTGRSKIMLDNGAKANGNQWRIEDLSHRPGNTVGAYAKWLVSPNLHTEVNNSATNLTAV